MSTFIVYTIVRLIFCGIFKDVIYSQAQVAASTVLVFLLIYKKSKDGSKSNKEK